MGLPRVAVVPNLHVYLSNLDFKYNHSKLLFILSFGLTFLPLPQKLHQVSRYFTLSCIPFLSKEFLSHLTNMLTILCISTVKKCQINKKNKKIMQEVFLSALSCLCCCDYHGETEIRYD